MSAPRDWRQLQASRRGPSRGASWRDMAADMQVRRGRPAAPGFLDRLLGRGASQALGGRPGPSPAPSPRQEWRQQNLEAVGSGQAQAALPRGRRGLGRAILAAALLAWGLAQLRPWQKAAPLASRLGSWMGSLGAEGRAERERQALERERQEAQAAEELKRRQAAELAALPFEPSRERALALWADGRGGLWRVDAEGLLGAQLGPGEPPLLLPELRGLDCADERHGKSRRRRLSLPEGLLARLLPLEPEMAGETLALLLDKPGEPRLLTVDGTLCLLGGEDQDWPRSQRGLKQVLGDLRKRGKRGETIDLRVKGLAVVKPAAR